jgi:hypothetical protein
LTPVVADDPARPVSAEGGVGGDQLVRFENRGVLLPHLLRRAVAVLLMRSMAVAIAA